MTDGAVLSLTIGFALDLYVTEEDGAPKGCVLEAGDQIAEWARTNADAYGIKEVIWNKMVVSNSGNWKDYRLANDNPHYDHVHVDCENP